MNGAMTELWPMMMMPRSRSRETIGIIHQSLASQRNWSSSAAITSRMKNAFMVGPFSFFDDVVVEDEDIHPAAAEGAERLRGRIDDWLALEIEGGVQNHGHPGGFPKHLDQAVIAGRRIGVHRLQAGRAVDVGRGGDEVPHAGLDVHDVQHEASGEMARRVGECEEIARTVHRHRRGEGSKRLAELDLA